VEDLLKYSRVEVQDVRERVSLQGIASSELHRAAENFGQKQAIMYQAAMSNIRSGTFCEIKKYLLVLVDEWESSMEAIAWRGRSYKSDVSTIHVIGSVKDDMAWAFITDGRFYPSTSISHASSRTCATIPPEGSSA
jgi:hypothetical protein